MQKIENKGISYYTFDNMSELTHFVTTRGGGISEDKYDSFNLSYYSQDDEANVSYNRKRLARALDISVEDIITPFQEHGDKVLVVDTSFVSLSEEERENKINGVDALITQVPNICIAIATADCVPILIYDDKLKVLAVVHAGWRGTILGIVEKTVTKIISVFGSKPENLKVGIGPSISVDKFEVGDEVGEAFANVGFDLASISFKNEKTGKLHIDLWKANQQQLEKMGIPVKNIEISGLCTYSNYDEFFSARRLSVHSGRILTGGIIKQ